jgi:hypothetical protein
MAIEQPFQRTGPFPTCVSIPCSTAGYALACPPATASVPPLPRRSFSSTAFPPCLQPSTHPFPGSAISFSPNRKQAYWETSPSSPACSDLGLRSAKCPNCARFLVRPSSGTHQSPIPRSLERPSSVIHRRFPSSAVLSMTSSASLGFRSRDSAPLEGAERYHQHRLPQPPVCLFLWLLSRPALEILLHPLLSKPL